MIELGIGRIRPEKRASGGSFTDAVVRLLEAQAPPARLRMPQALPL